VWWNFLVPVAIYAAAFWTLYSHISRLLYALSKDSYWWARAQYQYPDLVMSWPSAAVGQEYSSVTNDDGQSVNHLSMFVTLLAIILPFIFGSNFMHHTRHRRRHPMTGLTWCKHTALQDHVTKSVWRMLSVSESPGKQIRLHRSMEWCVGRRRCDVEVDGWRWYTYTEYTQQYTIKELESTHY